MPVYHLTGIFFPGTWRNTTIDQIMNRSILFKTNRIRNVNLNDELNMGDKIKVILLTSQKFAIQHPDRILIQ